MSPAALPKARLASLRGGRVLDVATGGGDFIRLLAGNLEGCTGFTGLDNREKPLAAARRPSHPSSGETPSASSGCGVTGTTGG